MHIKTKPLAALTIVLAAALFAVVVTGCGGDNDSSTTSGAGNKTDAAFVADMVPHHEGAIAMAKQAEKKGEHAEIREFAENIISAQQSEISALDRIGTDLHHMGLAGSHMGMSDKDMGMDGDISMLDSAKPFDRAFIDMMIPHHQGAIRMARQQLADGQQPTLRTIAKDIVAAQTREIAQMRAWRKQWYGSSKTGTSGSTMHHGDSMMEGEG
jgi:uncharacterized protein (DUF305 family)